MTFRKLTRSNLASTCNSWMKVRRRPSIFSFLSLNAVQSAGFLGLRHGKGMKSCWACSRPPHSSMAVTSASIHTSSNGSSFSPSASSSILLTSRILLSGTGSSMIPAKPRSSAASASLSLIFSRRPAAARPLPPLLSLLRGLLLSVLALLFGDGCPATDDRPSSRPTPLPVSSCRSFATLHIREAISMWAFLKVLTNLARSSRLSNLKVWGPFASSSSSCAADRGGGRGVPWSSSFPPFLFFPVSASA
mmetsp:Transcript_97163/g.271959  ORF Transcript_97163/g.271959 Transcript_97163/m.271959 type:complete len:248 (-) Transcript_97163:677-1420(-)